MDFAENWCSLLELFVSNAGLKLRMFMVDTVLVKSGRVLGHFYTSKEGYICRFGAHEITRQAIYQRLAALHSLDPQLNPFGYIAVAHYATGVSRLLKRHELQELMTTLCGPYEFADTAPASAAGQHDQLFALQAYVVPRRDIRYIASYDVAEGPLCTVLARRFSARYTNALDDPGSLVPEPPSDPEEPAANAQPLTSSVSAPVGAAAAAAAAAVRSAAAAANNDGPVPSSLTAEELLVESQLVAMGLLEPRRHKEASGSGAAESGGGAGAGGGSGGGADGEEGGAGDDGSPAMSPVGDGITSSMPAPRRIKDEVARLLQAASSFVERAHGQRIVGLVAEFISAGAPVPGSAVGSLVLMAVHAVQLDPRASRGRLGTFTERWTDYLEGLAPPPAPQAPGRRNQSPSILRASDASLVMTERTTGLLVRTAPGPPAAAGAVISSAASGISSLPSYGTPFNQQRQLLLAPSLSVPLAAAASVPAAGAPRVHGGAGSVASSVAASSLTRIYSASPSAAHHRAMAAMAEGSRPGSAPASVVKVGRHVPNSAHASALNGHYSLRNAMSAARPGGGGNPTTTPGTPDSYSLWLSREGGPTDSMSARLALEVESLRERLQRQTDIAVRAEAALQHLAVSSRKEAMELRQQIEELRIEVGRLGEAKRNLATEYDRLRLERLGLQAGRSELSVEVERLRGELAGERETLARAVRDATAREEQLEGQLRTARDEREEALKQLNGLRRRVEEETEVVEALRGQLYDYKQLVAQLQAQVRRGRNNKSLLQSLGGLPSAVPSAGNLLPAGSLGAATAGDSGVGATRGGNRNTKDGEDSDTETEVGVGAEQGGGGTTQPSSGIGGKGLPSVGGGGRQGVVGGCGGRRPSGQAGHTNFNTSHHHTPHGSAAQSPRGGGTRGSSSSQDHRSTSPHRHSGPPNGRYVTLAPPSPSPQPAAATSASVDGSNNAGLSSLLAEIRRARMSSVHAAAANPLGLERTESGRDGHSGGAAGAAAAGGSGGAGASGAGGAADLPGRQVPPPSPSGSMTGHSGGPLLLGGSGSMKERAGVGLGARKPNYDLVSAHDLFLMSWAKETLTPRMLECHVNALQAVAAEEIALAEIFNFYGQLGQVVWLDSRLTMNEKQFIKLALETGVAETSQDDMKEMFRKLSDKTEFASDASANHPHPYINFEQFPEAVLRLAALRYEWRPPENLEDAEEELYFASAPFMPPNPRESQLGDDGTEPPPRPPETVFVEIVKTYLKEDLLVRARRFKTAGSPRARSRSQTRTAPAGLWLSSKSLSAGM